MNTNQLCTCGHPDGNHTITGLCCGNGVFRANSDCSCTAFESASESSKGAFPVRQEAQNTSLAGAYGPNLNLKTSMSIPNSVECRCPIINFAIVHEPGCGNGGEK